MANSQSASDRARDARALLQSRGYGVLCTESSRTPGYPFGSVVNFALDQARRPIFILSGLAVHTRNLKLDPKVSLVVYGAESERDVLAAARMTVVGKIQPVPESERAEVRSIFAGRHPDAAQYMELPDFAEYRLEIREIYFIGGFGRMGWITTAEYQAAQEP